MKELNEYNSVAEVIADARAEGLMLHCVLCDYHITASRPKPVLKTLLETSEETLSNFLRTKGSVQLWEINRVFRGTENAAPLRRLVESGRVTEEPNLFHKGRGRKGLLYTWIG